MNQDANNSLPPPTNNLLGKGKRGPPCKDETQTPKPETSLVGTKVSGVVEGFFDAGYLISVKAKNSDVKLRGLVFKPGKFTPITPENDVAPLAKMYKKEETKESQINQALSNDPAMEDAVTVDSARALGKSNGEVTVQAKADMIEEDGDMEAATLLLEFYEFHKAT